MCTRPNFWFASALSCVVAAAAAALGETKSARLGTFEQGGQTYFALGLMPELKADPAQHNEVVLLVDTSASQAGRYRSEELAAVQSLLSTLSPDDRVQLMAVDMNAVPLSAGFVAPQSGEMQAALQKLNGRVPLGATDLDAGLRAAAGSFAADGSARSVIYIGNAMSKSNMLAGPTLERLISDLRSSHVTVSSYVLGLQRNVPLMAVLANQTGGVVQFDNPSSSSSEIGRALAASVNAAVAWPEEVSMSDAIDVAYPASMPPLRSDRDSILVGTLKKAAPATMEVNATVNGRPTKITWSATPEKSSEDFGFLPKLVDVAAADKGLTLPTVGSAGLREAAFVMLNSAQELARLGHEALASGNFAGAEKVADVALARDPGNPEAKAIKEAARKGQVAGRAPAANEPELRLAGGAEEISAGPCPAPAP